MGNASIVDVYRHPISKGEIAYRVDSTNQSAILESVKTLDSIMEPILTRQGYDFHNILTASKDEYRAIAQEIRGSRAWREVTLPLLKLIGINLTLDQVAEGIILPTWNEPLADIRHRYDGDGLLVQARAIHSYISSLLRTGFVEEYNLNPAGVVGIVHNQSSMVLGFRGGQVQRGAKNPLPAGSINPINSSGDLLFDTFYRELGEELGMQGEHIRDLRLVGSTQDHAYTRISLFVFDALTDLTDQEIYARWRSGEDRFEHSDLGFFPYETREGFQGFLEGNMPGQEGGLMQLGAVSLLAVGASRFGNDWFSKLPERIRNFSGFLSDDEKRKLFP